MTTLEIPRTDIIFLSRFNDLYVYAKLENTNPTGTIKYRTARRMILDATDAKRLKPQMGIIEQTSGNTGIALAYIGMKLGYPVTIVTGSGVSQDAKQLIRQYGAELVEVEGWFAASQKEVERRIAEKPNFYYWPNQVANPSSLGSNTSLGHEIADQFSNVAKNSEDEIDIFLASMGTGSTITGVSRGLKTRHPRLKTYLVLPDGEGYTGVDDKTNSTVPLPLFDASAADKTVRVSKTEAIEAAKSLHRSYEHYVGPSSGAVFAAAQKISKTKSGNAVIIFPDSGDRYTDVLGEHI